jgi:flagellar assembly factor FliW
MAAVDIQTSRFGRVQCLSDDLIHFPEGILGFANLRNFVLLDDPSDEIFAWLQSCEVPQIAFPVLEPELFAANYQLNLTKHDLESLDMAGGYDFNMSTTNTVLQDGGTPEDPTASMIITLQMELKGKLLYYKTFSDMYQIWGDGRFQDLQKITSGWEKKNPRPTQ